MVDVTILFFARAREITAQSSQRITIPDADATIAAVRAALLVAHPALASVLPTAVFALNQNYVAVDDDEGTTAVRASDEIAIVPPISGG